MNSPKKVRTPFLLFPIRCNLGGDQSLPVPEIVLPDVSHYTLAFSMYDRANNQARTLWAHLSLREWRAVSRNMAFPSRSAAQAQLVHGCILIDSVR